MSRFHTGDIVDITIKGARVTEWDEANDNLTVEYETQLGHYESGFAVDSENFTVTLAAPAEWPPRPGDLWCNRKGVPWFAVATATGVQIPGDERYEAAVIVHADDLERLTDERDADRAEIVQLCQERLDLTAERDSLKGLLSGSQQELRDAITAQGKAEAERDEVRAATLADAIEAVCGLQIRDASRFAEHHGHGGWCKGGTAPDECHGAEAHATANRVLDTLRALDRSGT